MPETPSPNAPPPSDGGKGGSILTAKSAGLPNWAWLLIIAAGLGIALLAPRFFKGGSGGSEETVEGSGLGLAVDPVTGLPYAVEGLVAPSGAFAGYGPAQQAAMETRMGEYKTRVGEYQVQNAAQKKRIGEYDKRLKEYQTELRRVKKPVTAAGASGPERSLMWPYAEASPRLIANNTGISTERFMSMNPGEYDNNVVHMGERYSI